MAEIGLRRVHKSYGKSEVIHGVDCDIKDSEFIVIVGPSGCGKSTLLRMIAGLESITAGEISIGGKIVNELEPAERDIAMVFQNYALYPHMSVYGNMAYGLKNRGMNKADIEQRVHKAAQMLELQALLKRKPRELSGGQRQRVAMGRAIVREPSVFLFDEPLSNLDAKLRVQMRIEIKRLHEELKITSVYVTHDQVEAMTLGQRLLVMNDGNVEQIVKPLELYQHPQTTFVAAFIGSPSMNLFPVTLADDAGGIILPGGDRLAAPGNTAADHAGRRVMLGIRPEHFRLVQDGSDIAHLQVDLVEELGADTLVHGHFGGDKTPLTVRLPGVVKVAARDVLPLAVAAEHLHLFAEDGGQRLN
jgi:sn-glycerol 3-phosphate transport system ATP-binding protein